MRYFLFGFMLLGLLAIGCRKNPAEEKIIQANALFKAKNYADALPLLRSLRESGRMDLEMALQIAVCMGNTENDSTGAKKIVDDYLAEHPNYGMFICLDVQPDKDTTFAWDFSKAPPAKKNRPSRKKPSRAALERKKTLSKSTAHTHMLRKPKVIKSVIKRYESSLYLIYKRYLNKHPHIHGTVKVSFDILPDGTVGHASIPSSQIAVRAFNRRILESVRHWRFQPIPERMGPLNVKYPLEFRSQDY